MTDIWVVTLFIEDDDRNVSIATELFEQHTDAVLAVLDTFNGHNVDFEPAPADQAPRSIAIGIIVDGHETGVMQLCALNKQGERRM